MKACPLGYSMKHKGSDRSKSEFDTHKGAVWKRAGGGGETEDEDQVCYYRPQGHGKEFGLYSNRRDRWRVLSM